MAATAGQMQIDLEKKVQNPIKLLLSATKFPQSVEEFSIPPGFPTRYNKANSLITATGVKKFAYVRQMFLTISDNLSETHYELIPAERSIDRTHDIPEITQAEQLKRDREFVAKVIKLIDGIVASPSDASQLLQASFDLSSGIVQLQGWQQFYMLACLLEQLKTTDADFTDLAKTVSGIFSRKENLATTFNKTVRALQVSFDFLNLSAAYVQSYAEREKFSARANAFEHSITSGDKKSKADYLGEYSDFISIISQLPLLHTALEGLNFLFIKRNIAASSLKSLKDDLALNIHFKKAIYADMSLFQYIANTLDTKFNCTEFTQIFVDAFNKRIDAKKTSDFSSQVVKLVESLRASIGEYATSTKDMIFFETSAVNPKRLEIMQELLQGVETAVASLSEQSPTFVLTSLYREIIYAYVRHSRYITSEKIAAARTGDIIDNFITTLSQITHDLASNMAAFSDLTAIVTTAGERLTSLAPVLS